MTEALVPMSSPWTGGMDAVRGDVGGGGGRRGGGEWGGRGVRVRAHCLNWYMDMACAGACEGSTFAH